MKQIIDLGFKADELNQEERNLISVPPAPPTHDQPDGASCLRGARRGAGWVGAVG